MISSINSNSAALQQLTNAVQKSPVKTSSSEEASESSAERAAEAQNSISSSNQFDVRA